MPQPKSRHSASQAAYGTALYRVPAAAAERPCAGSEHCPQPIMQGAPVPLCGKHLHEVYEFAQDMITENWDGAVRGYVSELHGQFKPPAPVKRGIRHGHVYFIRFSDRVKIGFTTDPVRRLRGLPHEEIIGVVRGTRADERAWHDLLADFHVTGEWFTAAPEVLAMLARVTSTAP